MKIKLYSKDKEVVCKDITLDEIVNNYMEDKIFEMNIGILKL